MKTKLILLTALTIAVSSASAAFATRIMGNRPSNRPVEKSKSLENWDCSRPDKKESNFYLAITFFLADDGRIYNPKINSQHVSDQEVAECLEAVLSAAPVLPAEKPTGQLWDESVGFLHEDKPKYQGEDLREYLKTHNQPAKDDQKWVAVHRIPLNVLKRYPGVFQEKELLSPDNIIQLQIGEKEDRDKNGTYITNQPLYARLLAAHHAYWFKIFSEHPTLTKQEIKKFAESVQP